MRILAVIDSFRLGGAETQLADALRLLTESRGHEALACSLLPEQTPEVGLPDGVERIYLDKRSPLSLPRLITGVAHLIRRYRPDVVYSRLPYANGVAVCAAALPGHRIRHVAGIDTVPESFDTSYLLHHPGNALYRRLERRADCIICNSASTARAVQAAGYPPARLCVIPNGIDMDRFSPPPSRPPGDPPVLVCVASLRPEKGVKELVEILSPVLQAGRATLTVVGDGPERPAVDRTVASLGVAGAVRLVGALRDVVPVLHAAAVYVSAAHFEGFGISVAEAAATGLPAVCTAAPGGLGEVIVDSETGYLIPPDRPDDFRSAVHRLCADRALRDRLGTAARMHVDRHYRLPLVVDRLEYCLRGS